MPDHVRHDDERRRNGLASPEHHAYLPCGAKKVESMGAQLNIKNAEAVALAAELAQAEGLTRTQVVLEALRDRQRAREGEVEAKVRKVMAMCRPIAKRLRASNTAFEIEDLYDEETGLPK